MMRPATMSAHISSDYNNLSRALSAEELKTKRFMASMLCSTTLSVLISWRIIKRRMQFCWLHSTAAPCSQKGMLKTWHPHVHTIRPYTSSQRNVQGPSTSTHTRLCTPMITQRGHLRPQTGCFRNVNWVLVPQLATNKLRTYSWYLGLARTIFIRCIYGIFGREITKYTVIYSVYIGFWPTLLISPELDCSQLGKQYLILRGVNPIFHHHYLISHHPLTWFVSFLYESSTWQLRISLQQKWGKTEQ